MFNIDGYRVHRLLGEGGMAKVYLATQMSLGRDVAIKVLKSAHDELTKERFFSEAKTLAAIAHPRVLNIYDMGELQDGRLYLVMEYLPSGDLRAILGPPVDHGLIIQYLKQICEGLDVVHQSNIVHRDVKPGNILIRDPGGLVLADFGIAKKIGSDNDLTKDGASVGSPSYCSPEQTTEKSLDPRSDLYSLGVILVELLVGHNPFLGESATETAINHLQMPVPTLPVEHERFQRLVDRLLAKDPSMRFESAGALLEELNRVEAQVLVRSSGAVWNAFKHISSERKFIVPSLVVISGLVLAASVSMLSSDFESEEDRAIRNYFLEAEISEKDGRFNYPDDTSAEYFYNKVLALDPENGRAEKALSALPEKQLQYLISLAESAFEAQRYFTPSLESAYFYYARVVELDSQNEKGRAGLLNLSEICYELAKRAFNQHEYNKGFEHLRLGLRLQPEHLAMLELKRQHRHQSTALKRLLNRAFK